jgi:hypothetical protein
LKSASVGILGALLLLPAALAAAAAALLLLPAVYCCCCTAAAAAPGYRKPVIPEVPQANQLRQRSASAEQYKHAQ